MCVNASREGFAIHLQPYKSKQSACKTTTAGLFCHCNLPFLSKKSRQKHTTGFAAKNKICMPKFAFSLKFKCNLKNRDLVLNF